MTIRGIGKPEGCKLIRIEAEVDISGRRLLIRSIVIRGDFFAIPEEAFERIEAALAGLSLDLPDSPTAAAPVKALALAFDTLAASEGVDLFGISGSAVAEIFGRAIDAACVQNA